MTPKDDWINRKWRPMMAITYMATCITDFILFPILWSILQALQGGEVTSQWDPITLQGAGLFHLAMGAILGVAAYSRGKEKLAGLAGGYGGYPFPPEDDPYDTPPPVNTGRTFKSRNGKLGPVIEEPLI